MSKSLLRGGAGGPQRKRKRDIVPRLTKEQEAEARLAPRYCRFVYPARDPKDVYVTCDNLLLLGLVEEHGQRLFCERCGTVPWEQSAVEKSGMAYVMDAP